jgi:glycerol uptake facilitator-like aquaporin
LCKTIRDSILILLFEFIGSTVLSALYSTALGYRDYCGFLMGVYVILILGSKISGSHYNPAVTVAFMMRKDVGRFSRVLGIAYIIA